MSSVLFLLMAFVALEEVGQPLGLLVSAITVQVLAHGVLHGVAAGPLAAWYGRGLGEARGSIPEYAKGGDSTQSAEATA